MRARHSQMEQNRKGQDKTCLHGEARDVDLLEVPIEQDAGGQRGRIVAVAPAAEELARVVAEPEPFLEHCLWGWVGGCRWGCVYVR